VNTPLVHQPETPKPEALRLEQRRAGANTFFEFGEESLRYGLDDGSASRTWTIEYAELAVERERFVERNTWWRNVGAIWVVLGLVFTALDWTDTKVFGLSIWLPIGAACLVWYAMRIRRFVVVASPRANVLVIDDASAAAILAEIDRRRAAQLRDRFDYLSPDESPEQQRHRVLWLQRQGSLDDHEVSARLLQVDLMAQSPSADPRQGERDE
jgi:hypothetical protein